MKKETHMNALTNRPNVLLILADQHRQDCLGCYGNAEIRTPRLDALAGEGVLYSNHYTVYPVCTPSRYSMLSGQYAHQHNAWTNESTLPSGTPTFPSAMRAAGYRTAAVGKMHFTPAYQDVGFDTMVLCEQNGHGRYEDDYHAWLMEEGLADRLDLTDQTSWRDSASESYFQRFGAFPSDLDAAHHSTSWITRQALRQMERWDPAGGNLLMVGYVKPHPPFDPPAPYSRLYDPGHLTPLPGYTGQIPARDLENGPGFFDYQGLTLSRLQEVMALYYGSITQIDDGVGELLDFLRQRGFYDNTMIIYTSDHGEYMGYHHMLLKGNYLYDPLARIPLIIKYPSFCNQPGKKDERLFENIDLSAEILACCGIEQPSGMCGQTMLFSDSGRPYVFSEGQYGTDRRPCIGYMIRSADYKLLVHGSFQRSLFFSLRDDPDELTDLSGDPSYSEPLSLHRQELIQRVLFEATGKNYCDPEAPQRLSQSVQDARAAGLQGFLSRRFSPF